MDGYKETLESEFVSVAVSRFSNKDDVIAGIVLLPFRLRLFLLHSQHLLAYRSHYEFRFVNAAVISAAYVTFACLSIPPSLLLPLRCFLCNICCIYLFVIFPATSVKLLL